MGVGHWVNFLVSLRELQDGPVRPKVLENSGSRIGTD